MEKSMWPWLRIVLLAIVFSGVMRISGQAQASVPLNTATQYFREAEAICRSDLAKLWGISLCGPMLFVDPTTRSVVANQADREGILKRQGSVFVGVLPKEVNTANTATKWAGVYWTEILWPLPNQAESRRRLIAHELYHRIQDQVVKVSQSESGNSHLDTLEGRYLLQLEWNALAKALQAISPEERDSAARDVLLFRARRYQLFSSANRDESSLELNEGLAEYTGVVLANASPDEQIQAALHDIETHRGDPTFVRSFAYATGPAYGLLLDQMRPQWRKDIRSGRRSMALCGSH